MMFSMSVEQSVDTGFLLLKEVWLHFQSGQIMMTGGQCSNAAGFHRAFQFPLPLLIARMIHTHSALNNRSISDGSPKRVSFV
jgi:hypothetical protein